MKLALLVIVLSVYSIIPGGFAFADEKCLVCHDGIEKISDQEEMAELSCTDCHQGNGSATVMAEAHLGMFANPSDLRVVDETCGQCHEEIVEKVKKSLHATMAGMISGTRYAWGAQGRDAIYATYDIDDPAPTNGGLHQLKQLPTYDPNLPEGMENSPADDYLRNQCLRCHLWSDGHQRNGDYRASGCAACHVVYSDAGTYEGNDAAIPRGQKDRPRLHQFTVKIPEYQCIHCHNRGGRTGVSFIGTMESDGYGTPWGSDGEKQGKLHGKHYNHLTADVHYEKGLTCIDCHTADDMHGDGNIYAKREQGVEIECVDCHGTPDKRTNLNTSGGNKMSNLRHEIDQVILTAKLTGKDHVVPQLADLDLSENAHTAMVSIPAHIEKLECYACHARWAPQCYGCHARQNIAEQGADWIGVKDVPDISQAGKKANRGMTAYEWSESRSYLRWESPILGINSEGKVSPFITGCQVIYTQFDGDSAAVNNKVFRTVDGTSGLAHNPIHPHTVSREARTCTDCHANRKTLGLGTGFYDSRLNGLPIDFELERIVDERGNQIQSTAHSGARPFNAAEQERIAKVGTCVACHGADSSLWQAMPKLSEDSSLPEDERHKRAIRGILEEVKH